MDLQDFESSLLMSSFDTTDQESIIPVKAEDTQSSGFDFSKYFWEPQPGNSYLIKFLPNPGGDLITHRSIYKSLPDPDRRGKTFQYISSGNAQTCPVLQLFFDLNALTKEENIEISQPAEEKIKKYLVRTRQACCKVQILNSPIKEEIGQIRMYVFSTLGVNATIANLINLKLNPSKEQLADGFEREDIFNIFGSSVLNVICKETSYDGRKGRDYSSSSWVPNKIRGAVAYLPDGSKHEFSQKDLIDGKLRPEVKEAFQEFVKVFNNEDYNPQIHFAYRDIAKVPESDSRYGYLKDIQSKVERIVPIIREKKPHEIAMFGNVSNDLEDTESKNIMADSVPEELKDIVEQQTTTPSKPSKPVVTNDDVDDILGDR